MYRFRPKSNGHAQIEHATGSDFCQNFVDDLQPLYLLAFLLTGSHAEAEQCFLATLDDALRAKGVFKGWEQSWIKRCLIINAIRLVFSRPGVIAVKPDSWCESKSQSQGCSEINAVASLSPPLQRFVFVMSVLEDYSEHECALLLGRAPRDVFEARLNALQQYSNPNPAFAKTAG